METAVNLVMDGQPSIGERVAVVGQGIVGLLIAGPAAPVSACSELTAIDPIELRRTAALPLGRRRRHLFATATEPPAGWEPADLAYELSGNPAA